MAKYRTYKNGITGCRYKGYYIIKGDKKGNFSILNEDTSVFQKDIYDHQECEWIIDKKTAPEDEMLMIKMLYEKEIYQLSALFVELMQKREREGLNGRSQTLYYWVEKVRRRKVEDREF